MPVVCSEVWLTDWLFLGLSALQTTVPVEVVLVADDSGESVGTEEKRNDRKNLFLFSFSVFCLSEISRYMYCMNVHMIKLWQMSFHKYFHEFIYSIFAIFNSLNDDFKKFMKGNISFHLPKRECLINDCRIVQRNEMDSSFSKTFFLPHVEKKMHHISLEIFFFRMSRKKSYSSCCRYDLMPIKNIFRKISCVSECICVDILIFSIHIILYCF